MKKYISALMLVPVLILTACGQANRMEYIGAAGAKEIALEHAGLTAADVRFSGTDMETRGGLDYYEVDFEAGGTQYHYDVDALTGVVIDSSTDPESPAETASGSADGGTASGGMGYQAGGEPVPTISPGADVPYILDTPTSAGSITEERALEIALEHAGLTESDVTLVVCRSDYDDGRLSFDVEFYTAGYREYDYEIDAATGAIIGWDVDAEGFLPPGVSPEPTPPDRGEGPAAVSPDQAKAIALAQVPGATVDDIRGFETDYDDGRIHYEGSIYYNGIEYEFEIDGYSGAIRNWDAESIYDD